MNAAKYYELTEDSYLFLCPQKSGHMNMGFWPATSLRDAQEQLVSRVLDFHTKNMDQMPKAIVDAGSGWGGSRKIFDSKFTGTPYIGVNSSPKQLSHAIALNKGISNTLYRFANIHDVASIDICNADTLISIEAAFHFPKKEELFPKIAAAGIRHLTIADICVEDKEVVTKFPLLAPALENAWSSHEYEKAFVSAGFAKPIEFDASRFIFEGWAKFLEGIDVNAFQGRRRLLRQFQEGFFQMYELSQKGLLTYKWFHTKRIGGAQ